MKRKKAWSPKPRLRFTGHEKDWAEHPLGRFLKESRVLGGNGAVARKLTVKLWGNGVVAKNETVSGSVNTQYYKREAGQFIYSKLDFLNGAFGIIPPHLDGFESTLDLPCFDVGADLDPNYLRAFVSRPEFYKRFGEIADGGRRAKRIQVETILSFPIALPESLDEQRKITACLASLDDVVAAQAQKVEALKAHKQGLVQHLFAREGEAVPRLRLPAFRHEPPWQQMALGDLFEMSSGGTPDRAEKSYWNGSIPWVTTSLVDFNVITEAEEFITEDGLENSAARVFPKDTVILAMYGQGKTRGQVALLGIAASTNQACAAILPRSDVDPFFTFVSLCGRYKEIRALSNAGGQENLSQALLRTLPFRYPKDIAEQIAIASVFRSLDAQILAGAAMCDILHDYRRSMLQQLFPSADER